MNKMKEIIIQFLDKIVTGEFTESNFPLQLDSVVIVKYKRLNFPGQIKNTKEMTYMFLM